VSLPSAIELEAPGRLPTAAGIIVTRRRARLLASAGDRALDLGLIQAREVVHREIEAARTGDAEAPRDHPVAVSTVSLPLFPDLSAALRGVARLLTPGGEFRLVEPVHHPGPLATAFATLWAAHPAVRGLQVERDVPAALRAAGFVITDIERFTVPTLVWPFRRFIEVTAILDPERSP
jgi:hypothetical protein